MLKHANGGTHCDVLAEDPEAPFFSAEDLRHLRRFYPRLRSILGHDVRAYSDLETVVPDIDWVAFLREPLTRTASHYQYDVQRGGVDLPFEEWITHDAVRDRQTRILAGPGGTAEEAIDLLGRFAFVGLTETLRRVAGDAGPQGGHPGPALRLEVGGSQRRHQEAPPVGPGDQGDAGRGQSGGPGRLRAPGAARSTPNRRRSTASAWTPTSPGSAAATRGSPSGACTPATATPPMWPSGAGRYHPWVERQRRRAAAVPS